MLTDKQKIENWLMGAEDNLSFSLNKSKDETIDVLKHYIKTEIAFGNNNYTNFDFEWQIKQMTTEVDELKRKLKVLKKGPLYTYLYKDVLSVRLYNLLMKNGIVVMDDLHGKTSKDLYKIRGFATKSFNELQEFLARHGVEIRRV